MRAAKPKPIEILLIGIYLLVVVVEIIDGFSFVQLQMQSGNSNNLRKNNRRNEVTHQQLNSHSSSATTSSTSARVLSSKITTTIKNTKPEIEKVIMTKTKTSKETKSNTKLPPSFDVKACWSKAGIGTCFVLQEMTQKKFDIVFDIGW